MDPVLADAALGLGSLVIHASGAAPAAAPVELRILTADITCPVCGNEGQVPQPGADPTLVQ